MEGEFIELILSLIGGVFVIIAMAYIISEGRSPYPLIAGLLGVIAVKI